jgi:hypothetical protein
LKPLYKDPLGWTWANEAPSDRLQRFIDRIARDRERGLEELLAISERFLDKLQVPARGRHPIKRAVGIVGVAMPNDTYRSPRPRRLAQLVCTGWKLATERFEAEDRWLTIERAAEEQTWHATDECLQEGRAVTLDYRRRLQDLLRQQAHAERTHQRRSEAAKKVAAVTHAALSDAYVRATVRNGFRKSKHELPDALISEDIVTKKRDQLRLKRLARQLEQAATEAKEQQ